MNQTKHNILLSPLQFFKASVGSRLGGQFFDLFIKTRNLIHIAQRQVVSVILNRDWVWCFILCLGHGILG